VSAISINDVDGDGKTEIVTCGVTSGYGSFFGTNATTKEHAELKVWSWDGTTMTLKQSKDWIVGDGVAAWSDGTADLANDGKTEIVTVGCEYYNGNQCDPDLRIWSLPSASTSVFSLSNVYGEATMAVAVIVIAVLAVTAALVLSTRRKKAKVTKTGVQ
jgi:hypothetical protein